MTQSIRRSQFITTYGPGAILEGPNGPRIIPVIEQSDLFNQQRQVQDFEIREERLPRALLNGSGIFRIPSNAELGEIDSLSLYNTKRFPTWSLCPRHQILYKKMQSDNIACIRCGVLSSQAEAWNQANRQAIRFVTACPDGHLDDVDWVKVAHNRNHNCHPAYLLWRGGGGALKNISIECPLCEDSGNFGFAYTRDWECTGRYPERETTSAGQPVRSGCTKIAKIIQRGAANLRISEIKTALTIPPWDSPIHRLLGMNPIKILIIVAQIQSKTQLMQSLLSLVQGNLLSRAIYDEIETYPEHEILEAINVIQTVTPIQSSRQLRLDEFEALQRAASTGHPPVPSSTPGGPPQFEIVYQQVRTFPGPGNHHLRITPVNRLRVVMVQTGYRRVPGGDPTLSSVVDCRYYDGNRYWYPGVELFGEGIFIDLDPETNPTYHFPLGGQAANTWMDAWTNPDIFSQNLLLPEDRDQLHPVFVWWHTVSHRLMNGLSVDSGYSSASVRERVFVRIDENSGQASGGVLLYTTQPGGDGTLGGLVALVPAFERVLTSAFRTIDACSNDPLCGEEQFGRGKYNGAACYACSLVSETSCEHRNMRLDRNLILENLP